MNNTAHTLVHAVTGSHLNKCFLPSIPQDQRVSS